ncbi:hypothetical protein [Moorena sp. SIO3A2]|uniref:hypothetical protein n=1 Tax=Moorena sp. SIO3A2 TaxID=2607841 RepID=UPI0013B8F5B7|nr:hypothetical protein [Moorena sp. SIO3A2]NER87138.1 hypothetical protein [Moorena sp. SIO3A2]
MPIAYCLLPIAYCLLPIAYCLLPIAYCLLPIAYCLLPIAYCLLPNRGELNSPRSSAPEVTYGLKLLSSKDLSLYVTPPA